MQKTIAISLTVAILVSLCAVAPVGALPYEQYRWVYEDYETDDIAERISSGELALGNATMEWTEGGAGDSLGAAHVIHAGNYGYLRNKVNMVKDQTYRLSVWLKLNNMTLKKDEIHFILYFPAMSDGVDLFTDIAVSSAGLNGGDWVHIEKEYKHDGLGKRIGAANRESVREDGTVSIRIGDGVLANSTDAGKFDFFMDDLIVEPIIEGPPEIQPTPDVSATPAPDQGNDLVGDGDFDKGFNESGWTRDSGLKVTHQSGGADDTAGCILLDNAGTSFGALKKKLPILPINRALKVSFYAKAKDGVTETDNSVTDTTGKRVQMIVDNSSGLSHTPNGVTKWDYIRFDQRLTDQWQKYEAVYYKPVMTYETTSTITPYIYLRVGDPEQGANEGKEKVHYYLDEVKIETYDIPYNGDFSLPISTGWKTSGVTAALSDDVPPEAETVKSAHIQTTLNYGNLSQIVPIEKGKSYEISFWAKGVTWEGKTDEDSAVPFSLILDRNGGKSFAAPHTFDGPSYQTITAGTDGPLELSTQWKQYTIHYQADFSSAGDCTPNLYWRVGGLDSNGNGSEYLIAGVRVKETGGQVDPGPEPSEDPGPEPFDGPLARDLQADSDLVAGSPIRVTYAYDGPNLEGYSLVRILTAVDGGSDEWITVSSGFSIREAYDKYSILENCVGKRMKVEVFPVDVDGRPGPVSSVALGEARAGFVVQPGFTAGWSPDGVTAKVHLENNLSGDGVKQVLIQVALYSETNRMVTHAEKTVAMGAGFSDDVLLSVPMASGAVKARVFVWEGTDSLHTTMTAYSDVAELTREPVKDQSKEEF